LNQSKQFVAEQHGYSPLNQSKQFVAEQHGHSPLNQSRQFVNEQQGYSPLNRSRQGSHAQNLNNRSTTPISQNKKFVEDRSTGLGSSIKKEFTGLKTPDRSHKEILRNSTPNRQLNFNYNIGNNDMRPSIQGNRNSVAASMHKSQQNNHFDINHLELSTAGKHYGDRNLLNSIVVYGDNEVVKINEEDNDYHNNYLDKQSHPPVLVDEYEGSKIISEKILEEIITAEHEVVLEPVEVRPSMIYSEVEKDVIYNVEDCRLNERYVDKEIVYTREVPVPVYREVDVPYEIIIEIPIEKTIEKEVIKEIIIEKIYNKIVEIPTQYIVEKYIC